MLSVSLVRTGCGNEASIRAAFARLGRTVTAATSPEEVADAPFVVLPGVGSFGAARRVLDAQGLVPALRDRVQAGRPTLAVCLGLQLLAEWSDETPGVPGLGSIPGRARAFPTSVRRPQLGWSAVRADPDCRYLRDGHAAYANSLRLTECPSGWRAAWSRHGGRYVAALERAGVLACQFHPELSGRWGADLLERWLVTAPAAVEATC